MGRELRAWELCENTIGKHLTDRLRHGETIQISASNGELYEIDGDTQTLKCITRRETYCVHPEDSMKYPFGDMVVLWWTFLHHDPQRIEDAVGPESEGHRSPTIDYPTRGRIGGRWIRRNPRSIIGDTRLTSFNTAFLAGLNNPPEMLNLIPTQYQERIINFINQLSNLYLNGDIKISWR